MQKNKTDKKTLRELRRAKAELASLKSYLEDCEEAKLEYTQEWNFFLSDFNKKFNKVDEKKQEENASNFLYEKLKQEHDRGEDILEKEKKDIPGWVKKAFRKIAVQTHPDKIGNLPNRKNLENLYTRANSLIEEENYSEIIDICRYLGIEVDIDPKVELASSVENIKLIKDKLSKIEKSVEWIWGESSENIDFRVDFLIKILPQLGYKELKKEDIESFLNTHNS